MMARQKTETLLSINEWASLMGISPWEFNGISDGLPVGAVSPCDSIWYQYSWQNDTVSREEIARAIADAEAMIAEQAGFWFAPKFTVDELGRYPTNPSPWYAGRGYDNRGMWKQFSLKWDKFIKGGKFARTTYDDANLTFSDADGDGVQDTFTLSFTAAITDPAEVAVYNVADDRLGEALSEDFRIRPINVSISGTTVTVTGHKTLCVQPKLYEGFAPDPLNVGAAIYVSQFTPARVYVDETYTAASPNHGEAIWNPPPGCTTDECTESSIPICLIPVYPQKGVVRAQMNATSDDWPYSWEPDRMSLSYVSGMRWENGRMKRDLAYIVAALATSLLARDKCGCERSRQIIHHWRALVTEPGEYADASARGITAREIENNPFGEPRYGALYAWKRVDMLRGTRMVSV